MIVAPPGLEKTIMGLELIARKQQPALIVVHRKQLFDQWIDRIESFLGIPERDIGRITRSNQLPELYDYRDRQIDYFEKLFKKRNRFYDEIRKANQMILDL